MNEQDRAAALLKLGQKAEAADVVVAIVPGCYIVLKDRMGPADETQTLGPHDFHQLCRRQTEDGKAITIVVISA